MRALGMATCYRRWIATVRTLITGASGLIGATLSVALQDRGYEVLRAVRHRPTGSREIFWNAEDGSIDVHKIQDVDAVINLAGENIGRKWWTPRNKQKFLRSRVNGTSAIAEAVASLDVPPRVLVSASAVGFYGDRGDEVLTEESGHGHGFRADVCRRWEAATLPAEKAGIRVVKLRSGFVLSVHGGILPYLVFPARFGFSVRIGSGKQYWSWISLEDEVRAIVHVLENAELSGPVNLTSPNPVRQAEFAKTVRASFNRGGVLGVPSLAVKAVLGRERANEILLSSQWVAPQRLLSAGFDFSTEHLGDALKSLLRTPMGVR